VPAANLPFYHALRDWFAQRSSVSVINALPWIHLEMPTLPTTEQIAYRNSYGPAPSSQLPHVVVVGGGAAGLEAARQLSLVSLDYES
jgi:NADPH-dependent glutamate synthase beta subunit-like oxidoreductase